MIQQYLPSSYSWYQMVASGNGHTPFLGLSPALSFLSWSNVVDAILMMSYDGVRVDGITLISPRMALLLHSLPSNN